MAFKTWRAIKFKVVKANGWNKYKVQKRFLFFFWRDRKKSIYTSKPEAYRAAVMINKKQSSRTKK